jgi:ribosomal protein S3AE
MTPEQRIYLAIRDIQPRIELTDEQCQELLRKARARLEPMKDILQSADYSYRLAGLIMSEKEKVSK